MNNYEFGIEAERREIGLPLKLEQRTNFPTSSGSVLAIMS